MDKVSEQSWDKKNSFKEDKVKELKDKDRDKLTTFSLSHPSLATFEALKETLNESGLEKDELTL